MLALPSASVALLNHTDFYTFHFEAEEMFGYLLWEHNGPALWKRRDEKDGREAPRSFCRCSHSPGVRLTDFQNKSSGRPGRGDLVQWGSPAGLSLVCRTVCADGGFLDHFS